MRFGEDVPGLVVGLGRPPFLMSLAVDLRVVNISYARSQEKTGIPDSGYTLVKQFGSCSDEVCFAQEQDDFIAAVDTLAADRSGTDFTIPESQTIALVRAAEDWSWRDGVLKVPTPKGLILPLFIGCLVVVIRILF